MSRTMYKNSVSFCATSDLDGTGMPSLLLLRSAFFVSSALPLVFASSNWNRFVRAQFSNRADLLLKSRALCLSM